MPAGADIVSLCEANLPAHASDCSGFVRAVAAALSIPLQGLANDIVGVLRGGGGWTVLSSGPEAATQAAAGFFVVGGLKGSEQNQPNAHGHVVVVVPGSCAQNRYPTAYWGQLGGSGHRQQTTNYAWATADRDRVTYAAYATNLPASAGAPPGQTEGATNLAPNPAAPGASSGKAPGGMSFPEYNQVATTMASGKTVAPKVTPVPEISSTPNPVAPNPTEPSGGGMAVTRIGDTMTHGAVLIFGSPTTQTDNLATIRLGDTVICPIHGIQQITSGCSSTVTTDGMFVSRLGARASCGAVVVGGSPTRNIGA